MGSNKVAEGLNSPTATVAPLIVQPITACLITCHEGYSSWPHAEHV